MKAGTKFKYPRVRCKYCKKMIAENWMVRHTCKEFEESVAESTELLIAYKDGRGRKPGTSGVGKAFK